MSTVTDDTDVQLTAMGLVRQAVENCVEPLPETPGRVMDVLAPFLSRHSDRADGPQDVTALFLAVLASLAQVAGVHYSALLEMRKLREPSKDEVLAGIDELMHAIALDGAEGEN